MLRRTHTILLASMIALALLAGLPAAEATHNNRGTLKVHDNEDENPDQRNVPHVSCGFWLEGFMLGDDSGWIRFYAWPPTGDKSEVTPTGEDLTWEADSGDESGEYHFLQGPYYLPEGHYRVEIFTHDGHPGSDGGHFAKSKTFWVEPCDEPVVNPPCPVITEVTAGSEDGDAHIFLDWEAVVGADAYMVYRATADTDFELLTDVPPATTSYLDDAVEPGVTYEYYVTAVVDGVESENCEVVSATAIPFIPGPVVGALALVGAVGAYAMIRRR